VYSYRIDCIVNIESRKYNFLSMSDSLRNKSNNFKPIKFIVWLFVVSSVMFFAAFTSAYIVRRAAGNWNVFELPQVFVYSSILIVMSSVTLFVANLKAKQANIAQQKLFLWLTFLLGIAFLIAQYFAWKMLVSQGVYLTGNPSGSFLYVISGFHGLHIIAGLFILITCLIAAYSGLSQEKNLFRMEIASIFWHFIDILWIYLYLFLFLNQ